MNNFLTRFPHQMGSRDKDLARSVDHTQVGSFGVFYAERKDEDLGDGTENIITNLPWRGLNSSQPGI